MFERPQSGQNVLLVNVFTTFGEQDEQEKLKEFTELALSAGADIVSTSSYCQDHPSPKYYLSKGRIETLKQQVVLYNADLIIFNCSVSPSQERNLEKFFETRVLDRTGLILDIFAQRARSFEGKLQVELAQLNYMSTRLVRGWTHLERQKGGIGLRGPGETQLETDRRLLSQRVKTLSKRLDKVKSQREQGRNSRKKSEIPTISLVGYTNAGKSTLFNSLTHSNVYQADKLFATLDPTLAQLNLNANFKVILADTVGFVTDLPHSLVEAFQSTLTETLEAHLLIHVIDASDAERDLKINAVNEVLAAIGADHVPQLLVFNKIDLLADVEPHVDQDLNGKINRVWLSAQTHQGNELLLKAIESLFAKQRKTGWMQIDDNLINLKTEMYKSQFILEEVFDSAGGSQVKLDMPVSQWGRLKKKYPISDDDLVTK